MYRLTYPNSLIQSHTSLHFWHQWVLSSFWAKHCCHGNSTVCFFIL